MRDSPIGRRIRQTATTSAEKNPRGANFFLGLFFWKNTKSYFGSTLGTGVLGFGGRSSQRLEIFLFL